MMTILTLYPTGYPEDSYEHQSYTRPEKALEEALAELGIEMQGFSPRMVGETLAGWDGKVISADVRVVN